ncbi:SRPBCC family protein [Chloroflexota bacterium]
MASIYREAIIKAPIKEVYNYISIPRNLMEVWPSLVEISDVRSLPDGSYNARWVFEMLGMRFEGIAEYTDVVPYHWFVIETQGGIESSITWAFRSEDVLYDSTKVVLTIEYESPRQLLRKFSEAIIMELIDQQGELIIDNLKDRFAVTSE